MFDYERMIKRAVTFFPTWSDIRKRYKTSAGGKLLGSITEEIIDIEQAINEYKKYYFLDTYKGHENEIVAFSYMAQLGIIEDLNVVNVNYKEKDLELTTDINKFFNNTSVAYYEEGNIYIREELYDGSKITIFINDTNNEYELIKTSVWNIFDEFACFVGLERHANETNQQLIKRILYVTKNKPNSSVDGLKHAIVSELLTNFPEIELSTTLESDIKIERVNETNLREAYKEFNTLLDYLNSINKDVYRWKKWDLDQWMHDFKSISYIPVKWDDAVSSFKNGVGFGSDLEVSMSSNVQKTDATVTLYDKSLETMNKYLSNKKIEKDITINFKRYNNLLNSTLANYTIKASPMTRLYPNEIGISVYEEAEITENVPIEKIYSKGHNIVVSSDNAKINDVYPYRLKFESADNTKDLKIEKCVVKYINKASGTLDSEKDLLKEKNGFSINALGCLVSDSIKQSITKTEDFNANAVYYFKNIPAGGFKCTGTIANATRTLYNLGGRELTYESSCPASQITQASGLIEKDSVDYKWERNDIIFNADATNKKINIKITANKFSFDVKTNNTVNVMVRYGTSGNYSIIDKANYGTTWCTEETIEPRYMEIVISTMAAENVKIGNFQYSNYTINFFTKINNNSFVKLNKTNNTYILPVSNVIDLKLEVKSVSGGEPVIKGIYIGNNITYTTYETDSFETKNGCYRLLEINSNANITLVRRDVLDSKDDSYTKDYDPSVSYTATENDAYIRLKLSDYSVVNNIITDIGKIETIEESGVLYYNVCLNKNQQIKRLTIQGVKNEATYTISLLDVVNRELADTNYRFNITTDRMYCSRLTKGVIIVKNGEDGDKQLLTLNSKMFNGTNAVKYEFTSIPSNVGVIWGVGEGLYGDSITGAFDYISFYAESTKIHVANNSYNLFTNEIKNVPVAQNFTYPNYYNPNALNFYTIESNTYNIDARFYNYLDEGSEFTTLNNWSVGLKNVYIKSQYDLLNESFFDIKLATYSSKQSLTEYIDLNDSYNISDNNTIYTEQYIVVPPDGMTVEYATYDGTTSTEKLIKTEVINVIDSAFKKLTYSNIDKVLYIGTAPPDDKHPSDFNDYDLLKEEGILLYTAKPVEGTLLYIKYTIKKPVALVFDLDTLYKLTGYTVETYSEMSTYKLTNMKNGDTYDLNKFEDFANSNLAYIVCSEPSFEGQMLDEHTVRFNKHIEEKTIMVKTGYYYINGREYYLFSEDESKVLYNSKHLQYENIDVSDDNIYTYKATNNFVRNSEMLMRNLNNIYTYDSFEEKDSIKFNEYTSCDSYNGWKTFNTTMQLTNELFLKKLKEEEEDSNKYEGFNGIGLKFTPNDKTMLNYAFIEITDLLTEESYVSLAATNELKIYIGEEKKIGGVTLKRSQNIELLKEITYNNSSIRTTNFKPKKDLKYYLIISGQGVLDDIVISDTLSNSINYHVKNIEKFGLIFTEQKTEGSRYKMQLKDNVNAISTGASVCSDGYVRMTSNYDWNITSLKKYETMEDFLDSYSYKDVEIIIGDYIRTPENSSGRYITDYINIDPKIINRLFFKINNISFNNMSNIKVTILTCDNKKFADTEVLTINDNSGFVYGEDLLKFVKLKIEIPENHIVDNIEILAEYKSDTNNAPIPSTPSVGELISPVFDSQESLNYNVESININDISNINDVEVYIRAMTEDNTAGIWSDWQLVPLTTENEKVHYDYKSAPIYTFRNMPVRFFQFKIKLISRNAYVNFNSLNIEVKK